MPSLAKFVKLSIYLEVNIKKYNLIVNLLDFKLYLFSIEGMPRASVHFCLTSNR